MTARTYMPGHYDGDGCVFPTPGHFFSAEDLDLRDLVLDVPGKQVEITDVRGGQFLVVVSGRRIACGRARIGTDGEVTVEAPRSPRGRFEEVHRVCEEDDMYIVQPSTAVHVGRSAFSFPLRLIQRREVIAEITNVMQRLVASRLTLRSPGQFADDATALIRMGHSTIEIGAQGIALLVGPADFYTILGARRP